MLRFVAVLCALLFVAPALAQENGTPIITHPFNTGLAGTVTTGGTLPLTNNLALAANNQRKGCIIQNQGTHNMSIGVHPSESFPITLTPGASLNCADYVMLIGDAIYITGTSSDTFVIWWQ